MNTMDLATRTADGRDATLTREQIDGLRARLRGPLLLPQDPGYEDSRTVWNGMIDRRPALVIRCLGVADVIAGVSFAREHGLMLCVKGGGHNIAGLATADGALQLDLGLMRGVFVDPERRIAHAQGGCLLGDVDRETQVHGLAALLGFVSNTGIAGLTLGGGFGYMTRRFGYTTDNVLSMQVVTADGRVVRASANENADLFWGLCGGGGNFGVVTDFEYRLFPVGPQITGGAIAWPADRAAEIIEFFRTFTASAPPELAMICALRLAPPAPWIQKEFHGKPIVALFLCHTGNLADGEKYAAKLKAIGGAVGDVIMPRPYVSQQSLLDATQPKGRRYYWKSEYLAGLDPAMLATYREQGAKITSPHSAIILFPIGEEVARLPDDHSAAGNRDARWLVNIAGAWDGAENDAAQLEWVRTAWQAMRPYSTGGTYINFLVAEDGLERMREAYGPNLQRLAQIKAKWDPTNLFRANKNIAPAG